MSVKGRDQRKPFLFRKRLLVSLVLVPLGFWLIFTGGFPYLLILILFMGVAGWEFASLFRAGGFRPAGFLIVAGVAALFVGRYLAAGRGTPFVFDAPILVGGLFLVMGFYVVAFERGNPRAGTDMIITLGGMLYIGFLGSYLYLIRTLPGGVWWTMAVLPAVWLIDSGAYLIGSWAGGRWIARPFSPQLSPKKTWEGFLGGLVIGTVGNALLCLGWQALAGSEIAPTALQGGLLGLALATLTPLGDLGKSMFKRQVGVKDSGALLPGHGGALDRVDTWLWAGAVGYYLIAWFFLPGKG